MLSTALLNMVPFGIAVLDSQSRILFANEVALDLLRVNTELRNDNGFLRARSVTHNRALSRALDKLAQTEHSEPIGFSIARAGGHPISAVLAKLPARGKHGGNRPKKSKIAVIFSDPEMRHPPSAPSLLRDVFHFTSTESSIAVHMMHFKDTAEIADELSITRNTLRDHLRSMFPKVNAKNQRELLHVLLRSPAGFRFPPVT